MSTALIPLGRRDVQPIESSVDLLNRVDDGLVRIKAWGYAVTIIFFVGFGGWAYLAPLKAGAYASGVVAVESGRKIIQHYEGGILAEYLVKEGEEVAAGQPVVRMRDEQQRANFEINQQRTRDLSALIARLSAERDDAADIQWSEILLRNESEPAVAAVMRGQKNIFEARRKSFKDQIDLANLRIMQMEESIRGFEAQIKARRTQMSFLDDEISTVKDLLTSGNATKPRLLALQRNRADVETTIVGLQSSILQTREQIGQTRSQIVSMQSERFAQIMNELKQAQLDLGDTQQRLIVATDQLERTVVRSPVAGVAGNKRFYTTGAAVKPGEPLLDVVPKGEALIIEGRIGSEDVDVVHTGMMATIKFLSLPRKTTPPVYGTISYIAPDATVDQRTGISYYPVRINVTKEELATIKHDLIPGMPAMVMLEKGERSMLDYLLGPMKDGWDRAFRED